MFKYSVLIITSVILSSAFAEATASKITGCRFDVQYSTGGDPYSYSRWSSEFNLVEKPELYPQKTVYYSGTSYVGEVDVAGGATLEVIVSAGDIITLENDKSVNVKLNVKATLKKITGHDIKIFATGESMTVGTYFKGSSITAGVDIENPIISSHLKSVKPNSDPKMLSALFDLNRFTVIGAQVGCNIEIK